MYLNPKHRRHARGVLGSLVAGWHKAMSREQRVVSLSVHWGSLLVLGRRPVVQSVPVDSLWSEVSSTPFGPGCPSTSGTRPKAKAKSTATTVPKPMALRALLGAERRLVRRRDHVRLPLAVPAQATWRPHLLQRQRRGRALLSRAAPSPRRRGRRGRRALSRAALTPCGVRVREPLRDVRHGLAGKCSVDETKATGWWWLDGVVLVPGPRVEPAAVTTDFRADSLQQTIASLPNYALL